MRPPRIVICTAAVGCGHTRAALAVREGILAQEPDARIDFVETLDYASQWFVRPYRDGYLAVVGRIPALAGWVYRATDNHKGSGAIGRAIELRGLRRFAALPALANADVVVTTHFLCARVLGGLKRAGAIKAPVAVCVTDVHPHAVWLGGGKGVDALIVADQTSRATALRAGAGRVIDSGIPIDRRFETAPDKPGARAALNLPPPAGHTQHRPVLLVAGGGLGLGGIDHVVRLLIQSSKGLHVAVICGRNAKLKATLAPLARDWRTARPDEPSCTVEGFTTRMPDWMAAADIMVGKPGGLTTAEACAIGLPMVLLKPLPGQEERNAEHLCTRGAALLEPTSIGAVRAAVALAFDRMRCAAMAQAAARLGKPTAAADAATTVLGLIDPAQRLKPSHACDPNPLPLIPEQGLTALPCIAG